MDHTIVHFEIPAKDPAKLKKFYTNLFGWKIEKWDSGMASDMDYWLIETVPMDKKGRPLRPGVNGGMWKKEKDTDREVNYISVESIDEYSKKIEKLGGKIVMPKQEIKGVGWYAVATDPEGNPFGLLQPMMEMKQ
jgi:predicted enzyme related to lactoylglutathione lyase